MSAIVSPSRSSASNVSQRDSDMTQVSGSLSESSILDGASDDDVTSEVYPIRTDSVTGSLSEGSIVDGASDDDVTSEVHTAVRTDSQYNLHVPESGEGFFDLLLATPYLHQVVLDEMSCFIILPLLIASKPLRNVCLSHLHRRKLSVWVQSYREGDDDNDANFPEYENVIQINDWSRTVEMSFFTGETERTSVLQQMGFSGVLTTLLRHAFVFKLHLMNSSVMVQSLFTGGRLCPSMSEFYVEVMIVDSGPTDAFRMLHILKYVSPSELWVKVTGPPLDGDDGQVQRMPLHFRGFMNCPSVTIEQPDDGPCWSPVAEQLSILKADDIELDESILLGLEHVRDFARQWQEGRRRIVAFCGCLGFAPPISDITAPKTMEEFREAFLKSMPYSSVTESLDAADMLSPFIIDVDAQNDMFIEVGREDDERKLVIVISPDTEEFAVIYMFEKELAE